MSSFSASRTSRYEVSGNYESIAPMVRAEVGMFNPNIGAGTRWKKGASGNPGGRPKSRLLSEALRTRLAEVKPDDPEQRTWAEIVAMNLVEIASSKSPSAVSAVNEICDRLEGRATQALQISDVTREIREKSDEELLFFLEHSRWPCDEEKALLSATSAHPAA